jgi:hypothetical protein
VTLATSIPRIFQFIPNHLDIPIPSDSDPLPVPNSRNAIVSHSKSDYPLVLYWDRTNFSLSDLTTISDDEHSKLGFLEHKDGTLFEQDEARDTRAHARAAFSSLLLKGLAPGTWSQASSLAINWYRAEMLAHCPELGLCSNNWKVDALATEVYSQWSKRRRETIAESVASKIAKRKSDDTNSDRTPQKKRKKDSSSVSTVSKNTKDGKAPKKSKTRASTSVVLPSVEIPTSVRSPSSPTALNSAFVPPPVRIPSPIPTPLPLLPSVNPNSVPPPARIPSPVTPNLETVEKQSALPVAPPNPEIQGRENQPVTKIINPLYVHPDVLLRYFFIIFSLGIFGKAPQVRVSRLDNPETRGNMFSRSRTTLLSSI